MPADINTPAPTGSPDECARCGQLRSRHKSILNVCPGKKYQYFSRKFDHRGNLETEYRDDIICPWCGVLYVIDDHYECYSEDETAIDCPACEQPFYSYGHVSYSFSTKRRDVEGEKRENEARKQRGEKLRLERFEKARRFPPGTHVRITSKGWGGRYYQLKGVVENKEIDYHYPRVSVLFTDSYDDDSGRIDVRDFDPDDIELA